MKKRTKRILVGTALALALTGTCAVWDWHMRTHYASAVARVVKVESKYVGESGRIPHPNYRPELSLEFTVDGIPVSTTVLGPSGLKTTPGAAVSVRYRKARPQDCIVIE